MAAVPQTRLLLLPRGRRAEEVQCSPEWLHQTSQSRYDMAVLTSAAGLLFLRGPTQSPVRMIPRKSHHCAGPWKEGKSSESRSLEPRSASTLLVLESGLGSLHETECRARVSRIYPYNFVHNPTSSFFLMFLAEMTARMCQLSVANLVLMTFLVFSLLCIWITCSKLYGTPNHLENLLTTDFWAPPSDILIHWIYSGAPILLF